jgi:hypothetical protein
MHRNQRFSVHFLPLVIAGMACTGCEDVVEAPAASSEPAGARSTYGKAQERAEKLKGEIDAYQQEVSRQADSVFDDTAARAAPSGSAD